MTCADTQISNEWPYCSFPILSHHFHLTQNNNDKDAGRNERGGGVKKGILALTFSTMQDIFQLSSMANSDDFLPLFM